MSAGTRLPHTPEPMHKWTGSTGLTMTGDSWGDPNGPLVILQHGGGQTRHAWKGTGEALGAAGYFAIALDARGHGDSDWAPDGLYGMDVQMEDLKSVIAQLSNKRPVLVGASMGGGTSLVAVGEDHIDATALVLVDIAHKIEDKGVKNILDFMQNKPDGFSSLQEVADAIGGYQPHRSAPKNLEGLAKNVRLGKDGRYRWHWDPRFLSKGRDFKKREDRLGACVENLSLPTLLVRGGLSDVLSEEGAQSFRDLCPTSEYVNVTDAGHMVAGDRNDMFASAVIEFLSRTVPVKGEPVQKAHQVNPHHDSSEGDVLDIP
ncbi:MAG: alpha/beta hydrolase [Pseudomonadales bacterium]|nr:alpha/beta hydrolase [Pseudomonadales bacterium]